VRRVAILTDFVSHDPAYSLCAVVANQAKMLHTGGYEFKVLTRAEFAAPYEMQVLDPGETGSNVVNITSKSASEIDSLTEQLRSALVGIDVVLTHDLLCQSNLWKFHVAARRIAKERPDLRWLHWVHSGSSGDISGQTGRFQGDLRGKFPNSHLVVFHEEEAMRKRTAFGYEMYETVIIPNPIDFTENYHQAALKAIELGGLWDADIVAVYPSRLDRGKQPHIIIEAFAGLRNMGWDARVVIIDFHSTAGDKAVYREEMKNQASVAGVPIVFTSDLGGDAAYHIPHKAVVDLFDFADILVHPSRSESDPLIVPEAAWARCGLVLNFDLPMFRLWQNRALLYKFSSNVDVATGMPGDTTTNYGDRQAYMRHVAGGIAYMMGNDPVLLNHARMRKEKSLKAVWEKHLWPAIEAN